MRAYKAWDSKSCENYNTIVFAENCQDAKRVAQHSEVLEDAKYIDIRVNRVPEADNIFDGHDEIDWNDPVTRLLMVKNLGWACLETSVECDKCMARGYCSWWDEDNYEVDI